MQKPTRPLAGLLALSPLATAARRTVSYEASIVDPQTGASTISKNELRLACGP